MDFGRSPHYAGAQQRRWLEESGAEMEMSKLLPAILVLAAILAGVALFRFGPAAAPPKPPTRPGEPPLKISYRHSQIPRHGMVAGFNNPSTSESITVVAVFVQGKGEKEERSYRIDREIKPLDTISVGWVQLDGWKLKRGDKLRIRCEQYDRDLTSEVVE
jgi:hypothetical protein